MAIHRTSAIPAHADVAQDISGPLPISLLEAWGDGEHTLARATSLLAPFRKEGTVAASDASGLSKLSRERDLLEVVWLVSQPKQILHAVGAEIGGRAIGVWVADNTEMLYPADVSVDAIVSAMIEAQARIAERAAVMIGICLHTGVFYEIGGGLYGADADTVEVLAEDYARAEEIIVTDALVKRLRRTDVATFERRSDLDALHAPGVYRVASSRRFRGLGEENTIYPHGFPPAFFSMLQKIKHRDQHDELKEKIYGSYQREQFVVFLARQRIPHAPENLVGILDDFASNTLLATIVAESGDSANHVASLGGGLAVLVFDTGSEAYDFARLARQKVQERALSVKIGIDRGSVLLFEKSGGGYEGIVGDPINLASKISEDVGRPGHISITDRAAATIDGIEGAEPFDVTISGVPIRGVIV